MEALIAGVGGPYGDDQAVALVAVGGDVVPLEGLHSVVLAGNLAGDGSLVVQRGCDLESGHDRTGHVRSERQVGGDLIRLYGGENCRCLTGL